MGIDLRLEDERGQMLESVADPTNILHRILPAHNDPNYRLIGYIDWYGDTTFNRVQMPDLRKDFSVLFLTLEDDASRNLLTKIDSLAEKCDSKPHLYLKFYGD